MIDSDVVNTEGLLPGAEPGVPGLPELPPLDGGVLVPGGRGAAVLVEGPAACTIDIYSNNTVYTSVYALTLCSLTVESELSNYRALRISVHQSPAQI